MENGRKEYFRRRLRDTLAKKHFFALMPVGADEDGRCMKMLMKMKMKMKMERKKGHPLQDAEGALQRSTVTLTLCEDESRPRFSPVAPAPSRTPSFGRGIVLCKTVGMRSIVRLFLIHILIILRYVQSNLLHIICAQPAFYCSQR